MTSTASRAAAVETARNYYNSSDADIFYATIWGGEDIHVGIYEKPQDPIGDASRRTVDKIAAFLGDLGEDARVLDIGSGYGGAARVLAREHGYRVVALNLSEVENERARALNSQQGLDDKIEVIGGRFEDIPYEDATFDAVWSQDAILHSGDRPKVMAEVARVLKFGGHFVFSDPMQSDDCPPQVLQPIFDRIHLKNLGSPGFYRKTATGLGLTDEGFIDLSPQLVNHYSRVLEETQRRAEELKGSVSEDYIKRMEKGLRHWIEGGKAGHLVWGIFHFRKPHHP